MNTTTHRKTGLLGRIAALWNFETNNPKARIGFRVAFVMLLTAASSLPSYLFFAFQTGAWQIFGVIFFTAMIGLGGGLGALLCRRGDVERGMTLTIVMMGLSCIPASALVPIGLVIALANFLTAIGAITQTLSSRAAYRTLVFAIICDVAMGLLEIYPPSFQYAIPAIRTVVLGIGGIVIVIFYAIAVRQFRSYPLHIKLILIFLVVALLPAGAVALAQFQPGLVSPDPNQLRNTQLVLLLTAGLAALSALGIAQLLAGPIERLTMVAERVIAGDLSAQAKVESGDEIGKLAVTFNNMTAQLRQTLEGLEQRVADRTKALYTSSEVSRRISTILNQDELVVEVVKQVQIAFNYYHAHIYLMDESGKELIMAGGTGEAGKAMLARGHRILKGKGLVGRAAEHNAVVMVSDVSKDASWLPNPLLPETKSEIAVPISIGDRVLGVLDVQHNIAGALKQDDADLLQSIANQVGFAVRNARSYTDVQAKADRESLITSIGQKIQGTITVESAMQVAIREIGRALNGAKTQIVLNENSSAEPRQDNQDVAAELKS